MAVLYIRDKTTSEFIPINTIQGLSAYQVAVKNGFIGTEEEWLASLKGEAGTPADRSGVNTVNSLASLPVDKDVIYATLSAATDISLASALSLGQSITIVCLPSAGFTQPIPTSNGFTSMDGDSLTFVSGKLAEISILCYATNNYSISSKIAS